MNAVGRGGKRYFPDGEKLITAIDDADAAGTQWQKVAPGIFKELTSAIKTWAGVAKMFGDAHGKLKVDPYATAIGSVLKNAHDAISHDVALAAAIAKATTRAAAHSARQAARGIETEMISEVTAVVDIIRKLRG